MNQTKEDATVMIVLRKLRDIRREGGNWKQIDLTKIRKEAELYVLEHAPEENEIIEKNILEVDKKKKLLKDSQKKVKDHFEEEREKERERRRKEREMNEFRQMEAEWEEREKRKERDRSQEQDSQKSREEQDKEFKSAEHRFERERWIKKMKEIQRERRQDEQESEKETREQQKAIQFLEQLNQDDDPAPKNDEVLKPSNIDVSALSGTKITLASKSEKSKMNKQEAPKPSLFQESPEEDSDSQFAKKKRKLIPLEDSLFKEKEQQQASLKAKELIKTIPSDKKELFLFPINWETIESHAIIQNKIEPWLFQKIASIIGEEDKEIVSFVVDLLHEHPTANKLKEEMSTLLEEETDDFVLRIWRMLVFEFLCAREGIVLDTNGK